MLAPVGIVGEQVAEVDVARGVEVRLQRAPLGRVDDPGRRVGHAGLHVVGGQPILADAHRRVRVRRRGRYRPRPEPEGRDRAGMEAHGAGVRRGRRGSGRTTIVRSSVSSNGTGANVLALVSPSTRLINGDGRFVAFHSMADNLVPNDTNGQNDVFRHDNQTGVTTRVSLADSAPRSPAQAVVAATSSPATTLRFSTSAALEPADTNGAGDVYVRTISTGTTRRVSIRPDGTPIVLSDLTTSLQDVSLSDDGRYVAMRLSGEGLGDTFLHDRVAGTTVLLTPGTRDPRRRRREVGGRRRAVHPGHLWAHQLPLAAEPARLAADRPAVRLRRVRRDLGWPIRRRPALWRVPDLPVRRAHRPRALGSDHPGVHEGATARRAGGNRLDLRRRPHREQCGRDGRAEVADLATGVVQVVEPTGAGPGRRIRRGAQRERSLRLVDLDRGARAGRHEPRERTCTPAPHSNRRVTAVVPASIARGPPTRS